VECIEPEDLFEHCQVVVADSAAHVNHEPMLFLSMFWFSIKALLWSKNNSKCNSGAELDTLPPDY
jgi:hypothetical protein